MKCNKCGNENKENSKFCANCGEILEQESRTTNNINKKESSKEIPALSWISLGFLAMQVLSSLGLYSEYIKDKFQFVFSLPYVLISLILAIISRVKNKDKMSLAVLIIDIVIIIIEIIFIIVLVIAIRNVIDSCLSTGVSSNLG